MKNSEINPTQMNVKQIYDDRRSVRSEKGRKKARQCRQGAAWPPERVKQNARQQHSGANNLPPPNFDSDSKL